MVAMPKDRVFDFICSECQSSYKVVRCAWPPVTGAQLSCLVCNQALAPQDGGDVLKYFLVLRGNHTSGERGASLSPANLGIAPSPETLHT
jgi:hypothetical protein